MIIPIFRPKHTLLSVAIELKEGLSNNTIYLYYDDSIANGHNLNDVVDRFYYLELILRLSIWTFSNIAVFIFLYYVGIFSNLFFIELSSLTKVFLVVAYLVWGIIGAPIFSRRVFKRKRKKLPDKMQIH